MKKRIFCLICASVLAFGVLLVPTEGLNAKNLVVSYGIQSLEENGDVVLVLTADNVFKNFDYGDIVKVSFGNATLELPICASVCDVDMGETALLVDEESQKVILCIRNGSFTTRYSVAKKVPAASQGWEWQFESGFSLKSEFSVRLKTKNGYLLEYLLRNIQYTNNREDYPSLSDEEFANFRNVHLGEIHSGVLYRSSSALNPSLGRNVQADEAMRKAGVSVCINLTETDEQFRQYDSFSTSALAGINCFSVSLSDDILDKSNRQLLKDCFLYMIQHEGIYCIQGTEGTERVGFFAAVLESLMGASYQEVLNEYSLSYCNYCGIEKDSKESTVLAEGILGTVLSQAFGANLDEADLQKEAEEYLKGLGLSEREIGKLKCNLAGRHHYVLGTCSVCGEKNEEVDNPLLLISAAAIALGGILFATVRLIRKKDA